MRPDYSRLFSVDDVTGAIIIIFIPRIIDLPMMNNNLLIMNDLLISGLLTFVWLYLGHHPIVIVCC